MLQGGVLGRRCKVDVKEGSTKLGVLVHSTAAAAAVHEAVDTGLLVVNVVH